MSKETVASNILDILDNIKGKINDDDYVKMCKELKRLYTEEEGRRAYEITVIGFNLYHQRCEFKRKGCIGGDDSDSDSEENDKYFLDINMDYITLPFTIPLDKVESFEEKFGVQSNAYIKTDDFLMLNYYIGSKVMFKIFNHFNHCLITDGYNEYRDNITLQRIIKINRLN